MPNMYELKFIGIDEELDTDSKVILSLHFFTLSNAWARVFMIIPEFRILRLTFHRKSALNAKLGRLQ